MKADSAVFLSLTVDKYSVQLLAVNIQHRMKEDLDKYEMMRINHKTSA